MFILFTKFAMEKLQDKCLNIKLSHIQIEHMDM
jgi:hypothetical protein